MAEEVKTLESKATFLPDMEQSPGPGIRYANGATLRREYLLKERAKVTLAEGQKDPFYVFDKAEERKYYDVWIPEAEALYPDNGEYKVDVATGAATYLGEL